MSERLRNTVIVGVMIVMVAFLALTVSTQPENVDRVNAIGSRIKCPVCQGESIANSPATMARDMMSLVAERVGEGVGDEEIIDELLASYSGALLLDPPASGNTLVLWIAPLAALAAGALVIVWWRRHPGKETPVSEPAPEPASRTRMLVGGGILVGSLALIVLVASNSIRDDPGTATGVAGLATEDLSDVSNETLEAVIAANLDHPQINGMRLALADRYYEEGQYRSAFPHYLAVLESPEPTATQEVTALTRLGWMTYAGSGEVETAIQLLNQALEIDPNSELTLYLMGKVRWCGAGESEAAAALFSTILDDPDLPAESRSQIEAEYESASAGEACQ